MRIALIAPFGLRAKGTTRARALPLARALARRGHDVALFVPPYDSPEDSGRQWQDGGVEVINVMLAPNGFRKPFGSAGQLRLAWRLLRAVSAWQPDVVHAFKPKGPSGLVAAALWTTRGGDRSKRNRRLTQTFTLSPCPLRWRFGMLRNHLVTLSTPLSLRDAPQSPRHLVLDSDDWEGPGGWNDDPRTGYSWLQRRFFAWQERYGLSHAGAWTVASRCLRERAIGFGADPERVFVLPNGVPADGIRNTEYAIRDTKNEKRKTKNAKRKTRNEKRETKNVVLYTRFAGVRTADVAAIWRRVTASMPEARLTVVGRGLGGEELAWGESRGVELAGWVEAEALPQLFARMAVAVVPWADTPANRARSSVKVRELMAAGLSVVAYAVGELPETLGDTGVLVPPGDSLAFAEAVVALLADPDRAGRLGDAAQARAQELFDWDRLAGIALEAYSAAGRLG